LRIRQFRQRLDQQRNPLVRRQPADVKQNWPTFDVPTRAWRAERRKPPGTWRRRQFALSHNGAQHPAAYAAGLAKRSFAERKATLLASPTLRVDRHFLLKHPLRR